MVSDILHDGLALIGSVPRTTAEATVTTSSIAPRQSSGRWRSSAKLAPRAMLSMFGTALLTATMAESLVWRTRTTVELAVQIVRLGG